MAVENGTENGAGSATATNNPGLTFPAVGPIYRFADNLSSYDVKEHLDMRLSQLEAMLSVLTDIPPFIRDGDVRMGDYFTACEMLAKECKNLVDALDICEPAEDQEVAL